MNATVQPTGWLQVQEDLLSRDVTVRNLEKSHKGARSEGPFKRAQSGLISRGTKHRLCSRACKSRKTVPAQHETLSEAKEPNGWSRRPPSHGVRAVPYLNLNRRRSDQLKHNDRGKVKLTVGAGLTGDRVRRVSKLLPHTRLIVKGKLIML